MVATQKHKDEWVTKVRKSVLVKIFIVIALELQKVDIITRQYASRVLKNAQTL